MTPPPCGHSACAQSWIDTGEVECIEGDIEHTGPGWPHAANDGDIPDSSAPARPIFLVLVWCVFWAIGVALCVAAVCGCYLIAAAIWGPA